MVPYLLRSYAFAVQQNIVHISITVRITFELTGSAYVAPLAATLPAVRSSDWLGKHAEFTRKQSLFTIQDLTPTPGIASKISRLFHLFTPISAESLGRHRLSAAEKIPPETKRTSSTV